MLKVIEITPTTRNEEIIAAIADAMLEGVPFLLGRYKLTLRGHLWMVDDTVSGLKNIDGISQGNGLVDEAEAHFVAKVIYRAWVADEWARDNPSGRGASTVRRGSHKSASSEVSPLDIEKLSGVDGPPRIWNRQRRDHVSSWLAKNVSAEDLRHMQDKLHDMQQDVYWQAKRSPGGLQRPHRAVEDERNDLDALDDVILKAIGKQEFSSAVTERLKRRRDKQETTAQVGKQRTAVSVYDLEQTITQELKTKYPPPVKRTLGTKIWEDAKYLALDVVEGFTVEELVESADMAMHVVSDRGSKWESVLARLKSYDEDYFHSGLHGVLVGFVADAVADAVERKMISTPEEAAEYDYYS